MIYTIKEVEGINNFIRTYHTEVEDTKVARIVSELLFQGKVIVKDNFLKEGDEIICELTEFTSYTRKEVKTVLYFKVERHDSFLLKVVNSSAIF